MSEEKHGKARGLVWLLVLLAILLIWIFWRPPVDNGRAAGIGDDVGALSDEIIVDFSDADGDARVAEVGRLVGVDFHLVSHQAVNERLYRAHVAPERRDAVLARLAELSDVEAAEPDAMYQLIDGTPGVTPLVDNVGEDS